MNNHEKIAKKHYFREIEVSVVVRFLTTLYSSLNWYD